MTDPTALPNFNAQGAHASLTDKIVGILESFEFSPSIDADGDVMFTVDGQNLFVRVAEGELNFIRIFGQWQITDDISSDLAKRLNAANDVTLNLNFVKVGLAGDMLVVSGEHIVSPDSDLNMMLPATIQIILQATYLWHQSVNSDGPHTAEGGIPSFASALSEEAVAPEEQS